jgi:peptidoglycan hydrolase CwlO-like protein
MDEKIQELERKIQELERKIHEIQSVSNDVVRLTAPYVSGTPSNNGHITITVNGKRIKLATVA